MAARGGSALGARRRRPSRSLAGATRELLELVSSRAVLGLPDGLRACLFDLDGVLTKTAEVHAAAWKQTFDDYLRRRARETGEPFVAFDLVSDYDNYVDGKPRDDGVRSFLASRGIELPEGSADDEPGAETIHGLGNRKNEIVLQADPRAGRGAVRGLGPLREGRRGGRPAPRGGLVEHELPRRARGGRHRGICSRRSSTACVAEREHLAGKPAPDTFLAGARALGVEPAEAAVFEDALAGVQAGRAGRFGCVVGVDRVGQAEELRAHGADIVVDDLAELLDAPMIRVRVPRRAVGAAARPSSTWTGSPRPSRYSRSPTATSGCAETSTRGSRPACRAPTWTASTSCGRCPTPRPGTAIRRPARRSST